MSQPKALFLADVLKADPASKTHHDEAADELRRLYAVNQELLEALKAFLVEKPIDELFEYAAWCKKQARAIEAALKEKNNG